MQCEVIQDGTGNYLKVRGAEREVISDRMFLYQEIPGFLPMELRRINGEKEYVFNISGRLSLKKFLDRENFSRTEIQQMFRQIFDMADSMEEYLLDRRNSCISILAGKGGRGSIMKIINRERRRQWDICWRRLWKK